MTESAWVLGVLMALASGLWLVLGSRKPRAAEGVARRALNASALRGELELLRERQRLGELSDAEIAAAENEFGRLLDQELAEDAPVKARPWRPWEMGMLLLIPVVISLGAFALSNGAQHGKTLAETTDGMPAELEQMVAGLAERLKNQPDDLRGWAMLGRSYSVMGQFSDAAKAFAQANRISEQSNVELLVAEAEALAMANEQRLDGRPWALLQMALDRNPDHVRALWYAAIAKGQQGDTEARQAYLSRLARQPDLPDELRTILQDEFGMDIGESVSSELQIVVEVDLAQAARAQISPAAQLFVYAKALDGPGMPLAVIREPAGSQWPRQFVLDDSLAMMENLRLSDFSSWQVIARVSADGAAQPGSGDWMSQITLQTAPSAPVKLLIADQIP